MPLTRPDLLTPFLTGPSIPYTGSGGKHALRDVSIRIAGQLIDYGHEARVAMEAEVIEVTSWAAAARGYREYVQGRQSITFEFGLRGVEPTLNATLSTAQTVYVDVSPHLAEVGPTNPVWAAECMIVSYWPISGAIGEAADASLALYAAEQPTLG